MKIIKPQRLGVTHRIYVHDGRPRLSVAAAVLFPFAQPDRLLPEIAMWKLVATELGAAPLDEGMNKAHGEVLVHGRCFTPHGAPLGVCAARVAIGTIDKSVYAIGDRVWRGGVPTEPTPFTVMPLGWDRAFGGEGFAENPIGMGFAVRGVDGAPLPHLELPGHLIRSARDAPRPAGLGPIPPSFPERRGKLGTYDARWLATRFPGFAEDVDWAAFDMAAPDQHVEGFFQPGTPFVVEHMHPDEPVLRSRLPEVSVRCFANRRASPAAGARFEEIATHVDTVHLFPHLQRGIAIHRGVVTLEEDDGEDLLQLVVAAEAAHARRPAGHYEAILRERLDPPSPAVLLDEGGLLPPTPEGPPMPEEASEMAELLTREKLLQRNQRRAARKRIDSVRAQLVERGMDASGIQDLDAPEPSAPHERLVDRTRWVREEARAKRAEAVARREEAMARARAICAEHGIDLDAKLATQSTRRGGPPDFSAASVFDRLRKAQDVGRKHGVPVPEIDAKLADPELGIQLHQAEQKLRDVYRKTAHLQPPVDPVGEMRALELRDDLVLRVTAGIPLVSRDLTGADLSGLSLACADLSGAFLESADLRGADLTGAKLDGAVLARAKLDGASLEGASLREANLGDASLQAVRARGACFERAELTGADLRGADLRDVELRRARLLRARLQGIDATGAHADGITLQKADLAGAVWREARLDKATFLESRFDGVDFSGAHLTAATFLAGSADGASFRGARLENLRVVQAASFERADFGGAHLERANLRGARLRGADLTAAHLEGADLSGADLSDAKLPRVNARGARLVRSELARADLREADLMESMLSNAAVAHADFSRANLFRADLAHLAGDDHTRFEGAHLERVRVVPRRKRDAGGER